MKKHWMIVLALLVFAVGCDEQKKAEEAAQQAAQNAKVAEAIKNQKRGAMTKPSEGPAKPADSEDADFDSTEKPDSEAKEEEGKENSDEKTETSAQPLASDVLNEAIAKAKADDKALFVHFTADW